MYEILRRCLYIFNYLQYYNCNFPNSPKERFFLFMGISQVTDSFGVYFNEREQQIYRTKNLYYFSGY